MRLHDTTLTEADLGRKHGANGFQRANVVNKKVTHFNTQTGKQNIQKHPWGLFSDYLGWMQPRDDELWHANGRINEVWQSGFDDLLRRPYIAQRFPENWVEIHPQDAAARGIESGDQVVLYSNRIPNHINTIKGVGAEDFQFAELLKRGHIELSEGAATAVAIVTPAIKRGVLFSYFLDPRQPGNILQGRVVDSVSGNYNYKIGVARVKRIGESKYKQGFRAFSFAPRNIV